MVRMLTEEKWAQIAPLLPPRKPRGRHQGDDRQTLEGILWVLRKVPVGRIYPKSWGARPVAIGDSRSGRKKGYGSIFGRLSSAWLGNFRRLAVSISTWPSYLNLVMRAISG